MLQDNVYTTVIQSSQLSQLPLHTKIYNSKDFSDVVCVKLPADMPRDMDLSGIYYLNAAEDLDFTDLVTRDEYKPWVDIQTTLLSTVVGQHTYRMTFSRTDSPLHAVCWFAYIIQDNEPDKPYIYMKRNHDKDSADSEDSTDSAV